MLTAEELGRSALVALLAFPLAMCGGSGGTPPRGATGTPTPAPTEPITSRGVFFDDFTYASAADPLIASRAWSVRTAEGGPGVPGATWCCVGFTNDSGQAGNRLLQLQASTDGTPANTRQSEFSQARKFYEGTYAARVFFSDAPVSGGPDRDQLVETFFAITPLAFDLDPNYGEMDFEYLPNGGWGMGGPTLFMTTWETYRADPWLQENTSSTIAGSAAGWHDLLIQVSGGPSAGSVKYFVDGAFGAEHAARYYPETPLAIDFNLWFIGGGLDSASSPRTYVQLVDWVYYAGGEVLDTPTVVSRVAAYRTAGTTFEDTVPNP